MTQALVAYYRVSTAKQGESGLGLDAQRRAVDDYIKRTGGNLLATFEEVESGKRKDRPELAAALAHCRQTGARLVIAKLDRLARNVAFLAQLQEGDVSFVACDVPDADEFTVHILSAVAQKEARAISERTKAALGSIKATLERDGQYVSKRSSRAITKLGGPAGNGRPDLATAAKIAKADAHASKVRPTASALRAAGLSLADIAARLNEMSVPTAMGKEWTPMAVKRVLDRAG